MKGKSAPGYRPIVPGKQKNRTGDKRETTPMPEAQFLAPGFNTRGAVLVFASGIDSAVFYGVVRF
jgi:hypothetical protein